jgi:hypothetical protein
MVNILVVVVVVVEKITKTASRKSHIVHIMGEAHQSSAWLSWCLVQKLGETETFHFTFATVWLKKVQSGVVLRRRIFPPDIESSGSKNTTRPKCSVPLTKCCAPFLVFHAHIVPRWAPHPYAILRSIVGGPSPLYSFPRLLGSRRPSPRCLPARPPPTAPSHSWARWAPCTPQSTSLSRRWVMSRSLSWAPWSWASAWRTQSCFRRPQTTGASSVSHSGWRETLFCDLDVVQCWHHCSNI